jgi:hypothetical protein
MKKFGRREPRAGGIAPAVYRDAEEAAILAIMRQWPRRLEQIFEANGIRGFLAGNDFWTIKFEDALERSQDPKADPEILATVKVLAELGHHPAREALKRYATPILEGTVKFENLEKSSSLRNYLVNFINGLIPSHPENYRDGDFIRNLPRDMAVAVMTDEAARGAWGLPRYDSSNKHRSCAWFVSVVMSEYGHKLSEPAGATYLRSLQKGLGGANAKIFHWRRRRPAPLGALYPFDSMPFEKLSKGDCT